MKTTFTKKMFLVITLCWMTLMAFSAVGDKIYPTDNIIYDVTSDTEVRVGGFTKSFATTNLVFSPFIESGGITYAVTGIGVFTKNTVIQTVRVPGSVKSFTTAWQGFAGCTNLASIVFEKGFTTLAKGVFKDCVALKEVVLPEGVQEIPTYTFQNTGVESMTFPSTVKTVNTNAFAGCSALKELRFNGTIPPTFTKNSDGKAFDEVTLVVPVGAAAAFGAATSATPFKDIREDNMLGPDNSTEEWNPLTDIRKNDFWLYVVFGQSNAEGYEAEPTSEDKIANPNLYNLKAYDNNDAEDGLGNIITPWGEWENVSEPNCRKTKYHPTKMGWVKAFGEEMLRLHPNKKIGFIHVAVASAAIKLFDKAQFEAYLADETTNKWVKYKVNGAYGGNPYQRIIDAVKKAQQFGTVKGILMHQGEEDGTQSYWPGVVKKVYQDMLTDLNLMGTEVPLVMGEPTAYVGSIANQADVTTPGNSNYIANSYLVEASDLPYNGLHFTHDGYVELGKRYAAKVSELSNSTHINNVVRGDANNALGLTIFRQDNGRITLKAQRLMTEVAVFSIDGKLLKQIDLDSVSTLTLDLNRWSNLPLVVRCKSVDGIHSVIKVGTK